MTVVMRMEFKLKAFHTDIRVTRMANVHYFEFTKEYFTFEDRHPFRELVYVDSGRLNIAAEGYNGTLCSKQLLIHKANEQHSLACDGADAPSVIIIGFECDCDRLDVFSERAYTLSGELIRILTDIIKEGHSVFLPPYDVPNLKDMKKRRDYPFGADQMLRLKLEMFLIELIRGTQPDGAPPAAGVADKKTEEICAYLHNHYNEKITLDNLCFIFGTNKTSLCRRFREAYGETPINYINRLRIKQAKKLMREGDLNLTQVAAHVGFSSIHYFSKLFKAYEHKSPTQYIHTVKARLNI